MNGGAVSYRVVLVLLLTLGFAVAQNTIVNGDFEQDLTMGWIQDYGGAGTATFTRDPSYQPDPDYEAQSYLYSGSGWLELRQVVDITTLSLDLSFWASFELGGGSSSCWPVASVTVSYRDAAGTVLGETRFYYHNQYCNWTSSQTLHLIDVANPGWQQYDLDVVRELALNLPGVDTRLVRQVGVALYAYTSGG